MRAAAFGPFIREGQFIDEAVLGFNLDDLLDVVSKWPHVVEGNKINSVVNYVLAAFMPGAYPLLKPEDWDKWISTSTEQIEEILARWQRLDFPLTEKDGFEIASHYNFKNEINKEKYKIEKKYFPNFQIKLIQIKPWGWVFELELSSNYPKVVVIVNKFNGHDFACQADYAHSAIDSYEILLSKWETNMTSHDSDIEG